MKRWIGAVVLTSIVVSVWQWSREGEEASISSRVYSKTLSRNSAVITNLPQRDSLDEKRKKRTTFPPDIETFIHQSWPESAVTRLAMRQLAQAWDKVIHDVHDQESAFQVGMEIVRGVACLMSEDVLQKSGVKREHMYERMLATRTEALATVERTRAYLHFQTLIAGRFFADPGPSPCMFNVLDQPN